MDVADGRGAVAAAEQQPCLHTAQEAAAVLHPVFTGGQAAAVVLHDQVQILVVPGEPDLDLPAGAYGPQGVGKQMKQQLLAKEENCRSRLELLRETVEAADPNRILQKGYTILRDEEGNVILDVAALRKDQDVSLEGAGGFAEAKVVSARKKAGKKAEKR